MISGTLSFVIGKPIFVFIWLFVFLVPYSTLFALGSKYFIINYFAALYLNQGLRASSLQFTSPLEFNAIFRYGFPLRVDLNGWSKIRDPVTAKFKHAQLL